MNVLNNTQSNSIPLLQVLAMCEEGTTVYVYFLHFDTVFIKRIVRPRDVMAVCEKCAKLIKHHPCVINITTGNANGRDVLKVLCV